MAQRAIEVGLDGVVITEHNVLWDNEALEELRHRFAELTILRGMEVSAANNHDILVYGVSDFAPFHRGMPVAEVVDAAHSGGGIAILAHPLRYHQQLAPEVLAAPFDAIETRSVNIDHHHYDLFSALAEQVGAVEIYSSDAHDTISLGTFASEFQIPIVNENDLVKAVREKAFRPKEWPKRSQAALAARYEAQEKRIQRYLAQGMDPQDIWRKVGGAFERVRKVADSA